jgi:hypothetical protein
MSKKTYPLYKEALKKLILDEDSLFKFIITKLIESYSQMLNLNTLSPMSQPDLVQPNFVESIPTESNSTKSNSYDKILLEIKQHEKMPEWEQHLKNLFLFFNESITYAEKYEIVKRYLNADTFDKFIEVANNISNEVCERTGAEKQEFEQKSIDQFNAYKNIYMPMFLLYCEMYGGFEKIGAKKSDPVSLILMRLKIFIYPYFEELISKLDYDKLIGNDQTNTQTNTESSSNQSSSDTINLIFNNIGKYLFDANSNKYMYKYLILQFLDVFCHGIILYDKKYPIFA